MKKSYPLRVRGDRDYNKKYFKPEKSYLNAKVSFRAYLTPTLNMRA